MAAVRERIGGIRLHLTPRLGARLPALRLQLGIAAAAVHRRWLKRVVFIGVTGSCGKTTTKELIAAALGSELRGRKTPAQGNGLAVVAKTILRTTRRDRFCVLEVAAGAPTVLPRTARLIRPQIAVVTNVGSDHRKLYRTPEATAAEKRSLVAAAGGQGTAVLNADDRLVRAMGEAFGGRVITYGCSSDAALRAQEIRSAWPEPLSFTLRAGERSFQVRTQLHGRHWVSSVLAALGVVVAMDVAIERAIEALAAVPPTPGRMSPVRRGEITFMLDDVKAPLWTMGSVFEFLAEAQAPRKIAVIGTVSDSANPSSRVYPSLARRALAAADEVIFVGSQARHALRLRPESSSLHAFATVPEAQAHLREQLRAGDLVLLKGSGRVDRLRRLVP